MDAIRILVCLLLIYKQDLFVSSIEELLFTPRNGVELIKRTEVPLLKVKYNVYQTALARFVDDWLNGDIGIGHPTEQWEKNYITSINSAVNGEGKYCFQNSTDNKTETVYNEIVKIEVPGHLKVLTSHRRWLRLTYDFLQVNGYTHSDKVFDIVRRHDLSKFTHREVLGYAIMFGDGSTGKRVLDTEEEKLEWTNTLHNHYAANPHHPEYFYPLLEDGTRNKTVPVLKLDIENGKYFLQESLIDMLAARGERDLAEDKEFNVKKWFDINERYFRSYGDEDKRYVWQRLMNFTEMASGFFTSSENEKLVQGLFDNKRVVFGNSVYLHLLSYFVLLT